MDTRALETASAHARAEALRVFRTSLLGRRRPQKQKGGGPSLGGGAGGLEAELMKVRGWAGELDREFVGASEITSASLTVRRSTS